jgi:transposase
VLRISDEHWEPIRKHFPEEHYPDDRPGRKPIPARKVLEAVLWILNTGAQWHMLPQSYPNYKTVHRRFQQWCQDEVIRALCRAHGRDRAGEANGHRQNNKKQRLRSVSTSAFQEPHSGTSYTQERPTSQTQPQPAQASWTLFEYIERFALCEAEQP